MSDCSNGRLNGAPAGPHNPSMKILLLPALLLAAAPALATVGVTTLRIENAARPLDAELWFAAAPSASSVMQKSPNETLRPWSNCATIS
jgi:hypothetical protein